MLLDVGTCVLNTSIKGGIRVPCLPAGYQHFHLTQYFLTESSVQVDEQAHLLLAELLFNASAVNLSQRVYCK